MATSLAGLLPYRLCFWTTGRLSLLVKLGEPLRHLNSSLDTLPENSTETVDRCVKSECVPLTPGHGGWLNPTGGLRFLDVF